MNETTSQYLTLAELIIVVIPTTLYCALGIALLVSIVITMTDLPQIIFRCIAYAICVSAIISGWYLIGSFIYGGARRLQLIPQPFWVSSTLGGAFATIGLASIFYPNLLSNAFWEHVSVLSGGSPMTIPLFHLYLEKRLRRTG